MGTTEEQLKSSIITTTTKFSSFNSTDARSFSTSLQRKLATRSFSSSSNRSPFETEFNRSKSVPASEILNYKFTNGATDARPFSTPSTSTAPPNAHQPSTSQQIPVTESPAKSMENIPNKELKPGIAYIFNHYNKYNGKGISEDVKKLKNAFKVFKLDCQNYENPKVSDIKKKMQKIKEKDFSKHSCIVIAILGKGGRHDTIQARDNEYDIHEVIVMELLRNRTLTDRLKFLLINACKGDIRIETDTLLTGHCLAKHFLKCYSTFEGYCNDYGSIYLKEFCDTFQKNGHTTDIESIMKKVGGNVQRATEGKQVPTISGTLTKPFIFGEYVPKKGKLRKALCI